MAKIIHWFMFSKGPVAVMHGSPWRYDTHVPIIFAGAELQPDLVHRLVHPVDVAPTNHGSVPRTDVTQLGVG